LFNFEELMLFDNRIFLSEKTTLNQANLNSVLKQNLFLLLLSTSAFGQFLSEFSPPEHIKSVLFYVNEETTSLPIMQLNESITLRFDDLNADDSTYFYTVERANANWKKSDLFRADFMDGYDDIRIQDISYSVGTLQSYIHYKLKLPNAQTRLKKSGNYILKIWDDARNLVLQKRFVVVDETTAIGLRVKRAQHINEIQTHQSVHLSLITDGLNLRIPEEQLKVFVVQNQQWQTWRSAGSATYTLGNKLEFTYKPETLFAGGNEYHFFETQDIRGGGGNVAYVLRDSLFISVLAPQWVRAGRPYTYAPDINGDFRINTFQGENPHTESDYSNVIFSLFAEDFLFDAKHFVVGDFNQHIKSEENKLKYNPETERFEAELLLKQGIYNYKFVSKDFEGASYDNLISGSYWPTENTYWAFVYYRPLGARCDELIAVGSANAKDIGL